jgi:hypothetical protein
VNGALLVLGGIAALFAVWLGIALLVGMRREKRLGELENGRRAVDGFQEIKRTVPDLPDDYGLLIYRSLQNIVRPGFPLLPDDDIWRTLGLDAGNLDDAIESILAQAKRKLPAEPQSHHMNTIGDVVKFLNSCPHDA